MKILAMDVQTIPDVEGGRRLYDLAGVSDKDVATIMFHKRRQQTGSHELLPPHLHRICTASAVEFREGQLQLHSFDQQNEAEIILGIFALLNEQPMTLISWNGGEFLWPLLNFRSLTHKLVAPADFQQLPRHDVMTLLAGNGMTEATPLHEMAKLCGLPASRPTSMAENWQAYSEGEVELCLQASDQSVLSSFLLYMRYLLLNRQLSEQGYQNVWQQLAAFLRQQDKPHLHEFIQAAPSYR